MAGWLIGILVVETIFLFVLLFDDRRDRTEKAVAELRTTLRREFDWFARNVDERLQQIDEAERRISVLENLLFDLFDDDDDDDDDDDGDPCRCNSRPFEPAEAAGDFVD